MARQKAPRKKSAGRSRGRFGLPRWKQALIAAAVSLILLVVASAVALWRNPDQSLSEALDSGRTLLEGKPSRSTGGSLPAGDIAVATVVRVVDGDTIIVRSAGTEERVRLLNVDTPESVHPDASKNVPLGRKASAFAKSTLENRQVRLESGREERDRYGRRLAYVFVEGENFNVKLVQEGWSPYITRFGRSRRYDADFRRAEAEARRTKRGIWGDPDYLASMSKDSGD